MKDRVAVLLPVYKKDRIDYLSKAIESIVMQTYTFFDMEVENAINALTAAIQPTVLAILGGVIAVMFMAMYMPILSMITSIKTY